MQADRRQFLIYIFGMLSCKSLIRIPGIYFLHGNFFYFLNTSYKLQTFEKLFTFHSVNVVNLLSAVYTGIICFYVQHTVFDTKE